MRARPWLFRTLWGALLLSLLLHLAGLFGDSLYAWLTRPDFEETALQQTQRKLAEQSLPEEHSAAERLAQEGLTLYRLPPAAPPQAVKPSGHARRKPVQAPPLVAEVASAVSRVPVPASAVAVASAPVAQPASAPAAENKVLARYPREVKMTYVWGVLPAHMTWKVAQGRYELRLEGGLLGVSRTFVSRGRVGRQGVIPERFLEYRNDQPEPFYQVDFDWPAQQAEVGEPGSRKREKLSRGDQDIFSAAFHIGLVGGSQPEYNLSLFSGRRKYESVKLKVAGEAKLRLGQKEVDALLVRGAWDDRQVDFWLAPEWHNIPVRITIALGKELSLDIWANEISMDGRTVLEWVTPNSRPPGGRGGR